MKFKLPKTANLTGQAVLYFLLSLSDVDESIQLRIRLNGTQIWKATFGSISRWSTFHGVIPAGILQPGPNALNFDFYGPPEPDLQIDARVSEVLIFFKVRV